MSDDEDVPPLEDMSEMLEQVKAIREQKPANMARDPEPKKTIQQSDGRKQIQPESTSDSQVAVVSKATKSSNAHEGSPKPATFGGMKKGFLFGGSDKPKSNAKQSHKSTETAGPGSSDSIPMIKPKDPESKDKQHEIPEVQEAMNASQSFLQNKDWVTEDLLGKVQNNETLLRGMSNPHFMQALAEFQSNPQAAMAKYQDNPEMQKFLKDFCGILGDHFSTMGGNEPDRGTQPVPAPDSISIITPASATQGADMSVRSSTNPNQATADDEVRMQNILADPEIREVLMDPQIQKLIDMLRTDPDNAQRLLQQSDKGLQKKIKKLVDAGLLQFQR